jgi:hypothetical protein
LRSTKNNEPQTTLNAKALKEIEDSLSPIKVIEGKPQKARR